MTSVPMDDHAWLQCYVKDFGDLSDIVVAKYQHMDSHRMHEYIFFSASAVGFLRRTRKCLIIAQDFCFVFFSNFVWFNSCMVVVSCFAFFGFTLRSKKYVFGSCGMWGAVQDASTKSWVIQVRGFACERGCTLWNLDFTYQGAVPWLLRQIHLKQHRLWQTFSCAKVLFKL